jgi:hypothetical protein
MAAQVKVGKSARYAALRNDAGMMSTQSYVWSHHWQATKQPT